MSLTFQTLAERRPAQFVPRCLPAHPVVYRGLAAHWPAVQLWSFDLLAHRAPSLPVQLVEGNREAGRTRFHHADLGEHLRWLHEHPKQDTWEANLKEFDLLAAVPSLRPDLCHHELFAPTAVRSVRTWIGPAGATTGLHRDRLDNLAVQVIGTKRWRFARPGVVERLGAVSVKYDAWAVLASEDTNALMQRSGSVQDFFECELQPGDVLHVPRGWWHEVRNVSASLLFGGFHGSLGQVLPHWLKVTVTQSLHRAGWVAPHHCTCHEAQ